MKPRTINILKQHNMAQPKQLYPVVELDLSKYTIIIPPENDEIYSGDRQFDDQSLYESLDNYGILDPLQFETTKDKHTIVLRAGSRRLGWARKSNKETVPAIIKTPSGFPADLMLVQHNQYRHKTPSEIYNEGQVLLKYMDRHSSDVQGRTSDYLAERTGLGSGKSWERLDFVQKNAPPTIKEQLDQGELSIHSAHMATKEYISHPEPIRQEIAESLETGKSKSVSDAAAKVKQQKNLALVQENQTPSKLLDTYQTIVLLPNWDLAEAGLTSEGPSAWNQPSSPVVTHEELTNLQIQGRHISEYIGQDTFVYLFVPHHVQELAYDVLRSWGLVYNTSISWCFPSPMSAKGYGPCIHTDHKIDCLVANTSAEQNHKAKNGNWFQAPWKDGSLPDMFIRMVQAVHVGPYLQVFTQTDIEGWHRA